MTSTDAPHEFLSLKALSQYSGRCVRSLRKDLANRAHPLTHYRIGGKIFVRRSDYDRWADAFRRQAEDGLNEIVEDVLKGW
jgi:hypothetical protein